MNFKLTGAVNEAKSPWNEAIFCRIKVSSISIVFKDVMYTEL